MTAERHEMRPMTPDDPRLSQWIEGRLPPAEAAAVEKIVAAAPELARLVADLRGMKAATGNVPAQRDTATDGAADDAEVVAEWQRLERERIEEEIAEARDDAAVPDDAPMRHRWPWLALAGALAAGMLVAVVIDRSPVPGDREVAMDKNDAAGPQGPVDAWVPEEAEPVAAAAAPRAAGQPERLVTVTIRSVAQRRQLEDLLAASGLELSPGHEAQDAAADSAASERIAVTGPAPALAALAAALESREFLGAEGPAAAAAAVADRARAAARTEQPLSRTGLATQADGPGLPAGDDGGTGSSEARMTIVIVNESAAAAAGEEAP